MNKPLVYAIFVLGVVAIGSLIGMLNIPGEWFQNLNKPWFNPPGWLFGPVWTTLYILIGIAGARTWLASDGTRVRIWFAQMALNFAWSPAFFGLESPWLAFAIIIPLWALIVAFIKLSWNRDRVVAVLFLPYMAWVSFATALNGSIAWMN